MASLRVNVALAEVLDAPPDPQWEPENQEFKAQSRALLHKIR